MNLRILGLFAAIAGLLALAALLAIEGDPIVLFQIAVFSVLIIVLVGISERNASQMQGCRTILAIVFIPAAGIVVAAMARLAQFAVFDPVIGWAGAFRFAAMLGLVGFAVAVAVSFTGKKKRPKPISAGGIAETVFTSVIYGVMIGFIGVVWDLIGLGLRQF